VGLVGEPIEHILAALFREVFKSVRSGVLGVVVNHYGLTEFKFRCSTIYICVLLIDNWKRTVTVVSATPAGITLSDSPEAFSLSARRILLNSRPKAEEEDAENQDRKRASKGMP
jgi:hypothetical protein